MERAPEGRRYGEEEMKEWNGGRERLERTEMRDGRGWREQE
jgi:hypothetical protein